ncbi:disulfide oxidoreductase YuzD [Salsuginibacillus halophilus]|uniref:Disulfide oxidoreductase YuzD n=1 Tax=Salsuginibacillus halophilus TaxID=517424 RepID=A0A2P8HE03_9BACI|nr:DUF1462 family protein [Salsuginibacillus halophilus]PSL44457.1 disulfide oxidoreductase YuzD [Salsuginibacillus halophilus]
MSHIALKVYGAERKCPSCLHVPSAPETKAWLEAALTRSFPKLPLVFHYIDIEDPPLEEEAMSTRILEGEWLYPLVTVQGEVVSEGDPRLKVLRQKIKEAAECL